MMWTDNPVRDSMQYDMEQEEKDRQCLHCAICGATIWDGEDYFEIDNMELCEYCMMDSYRKVADYGCK